MKVLYADSISFGHHTQYNKNNLRILSNICKVDAIFRKDYLEKSSISINKLYTFKGNLFPNTIEHKSRISYFIKFRIGQLRNIKEVLNLAKKNNYDLVIFSSIDIISFSLATKFTKVHFAFIDHALYYSEQHKFTRPFWKILNKNAKICLLEQYFNQFIDEVIKNKNRTYILHHPMSVMEIPITKTLEKNNDNIVFAPSNSNSKLFINQLVEYYGENTPGALIKIKGYYNKKIGNLEVYDYQLERTEYEACFYNSNYVLIPYDSSYNYRTSGVLFDAIASSKIVLLKSGNTLEYYARDFPCLFLLFSSIDELFSVIIDNHGNQQNMNYKESYRVQRERFLMLYSDSNIEKEYMKILKD